MVSRLVVSALLVCTAGSAMAQAPSDPNEGPPPPPPPVVYTPRPIYPAPLSQTTQATYVPQSIALSGPEEIAPEDENSAPPDGYRVVHRRRKGLLIAGPIVLGAVYGYTSLIAAIGVDLDKANGGTGNSVAPLFIPVLGPFIEMGQTDSYSLRYLLALDGAAQLAGAVMLYYGVTSPRRLFVRNDLVGDLHIMPTAGVHGGGMVLMGRF